MTIYLDNSALRLLAECETKMWLRVGQQRVMRESKGAREVGTLFHRALEQWAQGREFDFAATWQEFFAEEEPAEEHFHKQNVWDVLLWWGNHIKDTLVQWEVLATEEYFEVPLGQVYGEEVVYYGTRDLRVRWKGLVYIADLKTTGQLGKDWDRQWPMSSQLKGYVWAARRQGLPVHGVFVPGVEIKKLPPYDGDLDKKCSTHKMQYRECQAAHVKSLVAGPYTYSTPVLEQWYSDTMALVRRAVEVLQVQPTDVQDVLQDGQWRWPGCQRCSYYQWCLAGRPIQALTTLMIPEPWARGERLVRELVGS